jgi:hypothetical protein
MSILLRFACSVVVVVGDGSLNLHKIEEVAVHLDSMIDSLTSAQVEYTLRPRC